MFVCAFRLKHFVCRLEVDGKCTLCGVKFFDEGLCAAERLKSRKAIEAVFKGGTAVKAYPLLLLYREVPQDGDRPPARLGFVTPKRAFRDAHDRNFVKRRMREAYRLRKVDLYEYLVARDRAIEGMLIFTGRELPDQAQLHRTWRKLLQRLAPESFK